MTRSPYPLDWPSGWKRTELRKRSDFDTPFMIAYDGALYELRKMGASHVVVTSDLPTSSKGKPYITNSGKLDDPGIAVWWVKAGKEHVIACDRWATCVENMQAIHLSLKAMRGLNRWGASETVERAFAGFAALPPGAPEAHASRPWRDVLEAGWPSDLPNEDQLVLARARHRKLAKEHHPDAGGSTETMIELNEALAQAERELERELV